MVHLPPLPKSAYSRTVCLLPWSCRKPSIGWRHRMYNTAPGSTAIDATSCIRSCIQQLPGISNYR